MTSLDGTTWVSQSIEDISWKSITWSPELLIFVTVAETNRVAYNSSDFAAYNKNVTMGTQATSTVTVNGNILDIGQSSYQTNIGKLRLQVTAAQSMKQMTQLLYIGL